MPLKKFLLVTASLAIMAPLAATAQTAPATTATTAAPAAGSESPVSNPNAPVTRGEFEAFLRETLLAHPEIVMETVKKLHERHTEETQKQMKEALDRNKELLAKDTTSPSVGDAKADITVYEFFDYHCGYCKHMLPVVTKLLESDKKVRVVFLEFPILSEDSVMAARASVAVYKVDKDKYFDFHSALLKASGKFDEKALSAIAKKVGVDWKKVKEEMSSTAVTEHLDKVRTIAEDIGIRGTPAFIIGNEVLPGAVPYEDMTKIIEALRKGEDPKTAPIRTKSTAEPAPPRDPSKVEKKPAGN